MFRIHSHDKVLNGPVEAAVFGERLLICYDIAKPYPEGAVFFSSEDKALITAFGE